MMSDRIKIMRDRKWPDIYLSPQPLLSCQKVRGARGCFGGGHKGAFNFLLENDITDQTCSTYIGKGYSNG